MFLIDFLTRGDMVNDERYCEILQKLRRGVQNKRRGVLLLVLSCCTTTFAHTRLGGKHISCRISAGRCSIIHPIVRTSRPVISIISFTSRNSCPVSINVFRMTGGDECHTVVAIPGDIRLRHRDTKVGPTVWQMSQFRKWICWNIAQNLLYMFQ